MDLVKIDGVVYDVLVTALQRKPTVVEGGNSGTALYRQREIRDIEGIKYAHSITFAPNEEAPELFDALFSYLFDSIRESVFLEVVHGQDTISYEAAYSTGAQPIDYIDGKTGFVGWGDLTVEFRSIETVVNAAGV
jgi:hypothetical protein